MGRLSANAEKIEINDMRDYLLSIQMPESYLDTLTDEYIEKTYHEYYGKCVEIGEVETMYLSEENEEIQTRGTIGSDEMEFRIFPSYFYKSYTQKELINVKITVSFNWLDFPIWHRTDAIVVNWDSNVFTYQVGTFESYEIICFNVTNPQTRHHTELAELTQGGLGFDVSLKSEMFQDDAAFLTELKGGASFYLLPSQNPMYQGTGSDGYYTTSVNAQYRHNRNPFVGSVGFSVSGLTVGFDLSTFTDTVANGCNINYKY